MAAEFRQLPDLDIPDYNEALPLGPSDLKHGILPNGMRYYLIQTPVQFQNRNCLDQAQVRPAGTTSSNAQSLKRELR